MDDRILIAYASKSGTTREVAAAIGEQLTANGATVEVRPVREVATLDGYAAVVIGSAVRVGRWLPEATAFVKKHQAALREVPTAIFTVHMLALDDSEASRQKRETYLAPVREMLDPISEAFFAGRIEPGRLGWVERLMTKAVKPPLGDSRDWEAIRAWADVLPRAMGLTG